MILNTLPDVPLHRIFDYLDTKTLLQSVGLTCTYLHKAVRSYNGFQLDSIPIFTSDFQRITTNIPAKNIISLMIIINDQTQISEFSQFINLQRLTLIRINYNLLKNIFKQITSDRLRTLSIKIPWLNQEEICNIFDILLRFIHQSNITNLLLDVSDISLKEQKQQEIFFNIIQPFANILKQLKISYCYLRIYQQILVNHSCLQSLEIDHLLDYYTNNGDLPTDISQFRSQLTSLTLNEYSLSIEDLHLILKLTPFLTNLHLIYESYNFVDMCNGFLWKNFIKSNLKLLKTFEFTFSYNVHKDSSIPSLHKIIAQFKTPFWLEDQHCHVQCEFILKSSRIIVSTQSIDSIRNSGTVIRCNSKSATDINYVILNRHHQTNHLKSKSMEKILTTIDMSEYRQLEEYQIKYFAAAIAYNQVLTSLKIQTKQFNENNIQYIISALKSAKSIQTLTFENDRNNDEITQNLLEALTFKSTLKVLDLSSNHLNLSSAILLSRILQYNNINLLYIRRNRIDDEVIKYLANTLETNRTVEVLDLGENNINSSEVQYLSVVLKENQTLIKLDLQSNMIFDKGGEYLADGLKNNKTLKTLILSYMSIGTNGIKHLADSLEQNNTLTTIDLSHNSIDIVGAEYLANSLKINTTLTTLILMYNQIGTTGVEHLANALQINKTLTILDLRANKIGPIGAKYLSNALKYNTTLTSLNVRGNQIGCEGAQYFADLLQSNKTLTTLVLENNAIGDQGTAYIADALKINETLTTLSIALNDIGKQGAEHIAEILRTNKTLTTLILEKNSIENKGIESIANALRDNMTITTIIISKDASINELLLTTIDQYVRRNRTLVNE